MKKRILTKKSITNLTYLNPGDRFYFNNDSSKKVWQVVEHIIIKFKTHETKVTACINDLYEIKKFSRSRQVIFMSKIIALKMLPDISYLRSQKRRVEQSLLFN